MALGDIRQAEELKSILANFTISGNLPQPTIPKMQFIEVFLYQHRQALKG
jgi:hypothetical protein